MDETNSIVPDPPLVAESGANEGQGAGDVADGRRADLGVVGTLEVAVVVAKDALAAADSVCAAIGDVEKLRTANRAEDEKKLEEVAKKVLQAVKKVPDTLYPLSLDAFEAARQKVEAAKEKIRAAQEAVQGLADELQPLKDTVKGAEGELQAAQANLRAAEDKHQAAVTHLAADVPAGATKRQTGSGESATELLSGAERTKLVAAIESARKGLRVAEGGLRSREAQIRGHLDTRLKELREATQELFEAGEKVPETLFAFQPLAYTKIKNLLELDAYPEHKKALEEWYRRIADLSNRVSRREARSSDVTNQIFNIIGWFAVFLGVVLTAVSQLTQTQGQSNLCKKIQFPIVLTVVGTLITILGIFYKFRILKSLEVTIRSDKQTSEELQERVNILESIGPQKFSFRFNVNDNRAKRSSGSFWIYSGFVIFALLLLMVLFIWSYLVILCDWN